MSPIPAVLLWVEAIRFDPRRGATVLSGHDFREDFGWLFAEIPPDLFAWRCGERLTLRTVDLANLHRFSKGTEWETRTPERFPDSPFLLTDAVECRSVFRGTVRIQLTAWGREEVAAQFEQFGQSPIPVLGGGWFGIVQVDARDHSRGELEAYSREVVQIQVNEVTVNWAGEDQQLGQLVIA